MKNKWYSYYTNTLNDVFHTAILLFDPQGIVEHKEIKDYLIEHSIEFHHFKSELGLRKFLRTNENNKKLIRIDTEEKYNQIPSQIRNDSKQIQWSMGDIFPSFDEKALSCIPVQWLPYLCSYNKHAKFQGERLSYQDTLDFILRNKFSLTLTQELTPTIQLYASLMILEEYDSIPSWITDWLSYNNSFYSSSIPFHLNKDSFYRWLQDIWHQFCNTLPTINQHPFDFSNHLLNTMIEKLFNEKKLEPYMAIPISSNLKNYIESNPWINVGLIIEKKQNIQLLVEKLRQKYTFLLELLEKDLDCAQWVEISKVKGELEYYATYFDLEHLLNEEIIIAIDDKFIQWIKENYHHLWFRSFKDHPWVVHQALPHIKEKNNKKNVLICFDGMSFQEWMVIEKYLNERYIKQFLVEGIYAWIPTLTSISRNALFSGLENVAKQDASEEKLFNNFWVNQNIKNTDIKLYKNQPLEWSEEYLYYDHLGIIFNTVDNLAHSDLYIGASKKTMLFNLYENLCQSSLDEVIKQFIAHQYNIYVTSDHGTIKAYGNDIIESKYLMETKSKRALIYSRRNIAENLISLHSDSALWLYSNENTMQEKMAIMPMKREMFDRKKYSQITHGGCTVDEVIVPFIKILP